MVSMPKVSVIIPVYNRAQMVVEAIESVFGQTFRDFELLVVDDGSTDGTWDALQAYGPRLRAWRKPHAGAAAARNLGIKNAGGEYLAFLDSDDLWRPEKLARQVEYLDRHPEAALVHCDGWWIKGPEVPPDLASRPTFYANRPIPQGPDAARYLMSSPIPTPYIMMRRNVAERIGGFAEDLRLHEDADFLLRLLEAGEQIGYVPEPLAIVRIPADAKPGPSLEYILESIEVQKRSLRRTMVMRPFILPALGRSHLLAAAALYQKGDRLGFFTHCLAAWRLRPRSLRRLLALPAVLLPAPWGRACLARLWGK
jgi:glycosyltransferase involved in cell wall biosynthesis